jgi:hypothetical protein
LKCVDTTPWGTTERAVFYGGAAVSFMNGKLLLFALLIGTMSLNIPIYLMAGT